MATSPSNIVKMQQTETEVAVLKVQVKNIEDKVDDIRVSIDKHADTTERILKEMREASATAHESTSKKISALEKWRWMMMGAGILLGSVGIDSISKLLK